jgi:hypothetical protein
MRRRQSRAVAGLDSESEHRRITAQQSKVLAGEADISRAERRSSVEF